MKEDKQFVAMTMKKDLVAQLREEAKEMGLTLSAYIRFILMNRKKR